MNVNDYVKACKTTESNPIDALENINGKTSVMRLLHAGMGISSEAGEFIDPLKKAIFYGKELDLDVLLNLQEELGDMLWYISIASSAINDLLLSCDNKNQVRDLEDIMKQNIEKLSARYPNLFTKESALNRDLDAEKEVLKSSRSEKF